MKRSRLAAAALALAVPAALAAVSPAVAAPGAPPEPQELTWVGRNPSDAVPEGKTATYDIDVTKGTITFTGYREGRTADAAGEAGAADEASPFRPTTKVRTPPEASDCTLYAPVPYKWYGFYQSGQIWNDAGYPHRNRMNSGKWTCRATYYEQRTNNGPFSTPKLAPHSDATFRSGSARVEIVRIF
ncbi:hypothetical protein AB0K89_24810 [Streptomyces cinnamoneus]|uniref:hypothetical protein n=1 Tax=Streptomyces cinnamoneus TaxID=53446 RepID=UPI00343BA9A4